ncbi:uncharacterized protein YlxW (UPF0749 family) [Jatrophihabitans sp. GAS493]|uniref:DUF881 domain-containing protein n=1 Tax=Jatrophihabitans sp. GAS493 TaxID=1907575 RepID=UPI000BB85052|nr:DUF881 domain-containing protein [Jatrophihabitans sp. GAS493]SOD71167.1 uncharacterized protein YlxW (UPF0749 family) [Jatrophihabitans sp. GAS493]
MSSADAQSVPASDASHRSGERVIPPPPRRSWRWQVGVPVVFVVAGVMFATSHSVSRGTDLRSSSDVNLASLVRTAQANLDAQAATLAKLQAQVKSETDAAAVGNQAVARAQAAAAPLRAPAGLTAVSGPGLTVTLDDAKSVPSDPNVDLNELVVHQSDLQAVVNAMWEGGAEAMTIAGQRVIATSAVRCVGNTLLLNGRVYSPPFRVAAIGPSRTMQKALDASAGVRLFRQAATYYGLDYSTATSDELTLPAYGQAISLTYAKAGSK